MPRNCKMSGDEGTTATNTASTASVGSAQMQQSSLPSGIPMPNLLNLDNVAVNWKNWDNYTVVVRLQQFDEEYRTATFFLRSAKKLLKFTRVWHLTPPKVRKYLILLFKNSKNTVLAKPIRHSSGIYLTPSQKEDESIDHYVSALRTLAK